jgi:hypothetical protein
MELLICIDALQARVGQADHRRLPYFGYARQDRNPGPRTPISAKLVANLITTPAPTGCCRSICTPARSRASSISRPTTSAPRR